MATLELQEISKSYRGGETVVGPCTSSVADGEFLALLGPSGCGKSTLLRMIAGLESASSGEILIDSQRVTARPGKSRDVAMVFQDYALYPQMTARQNIAFPLQLRKMPKARIAQQVEQTAEVLGLRTVLDRLPAYMSGGQRQRVAMARALVRRPKILLLDEPLSNLDSTLRDQMRSEIRRITQDAGVTTVYVTHDQTEALTMADRVAVLREGQIEQLAAPMDLYTRPATTFVAGFLGNPPMNLIAANLSEEGRLTLSTVADTLTQQENPGARALHVTSRPGAAREVLIGLRPEQLRISGYTAGSGQVGPAEAVRWRARLVSAEATGSETLFRLDIGTGVPLRVKAPGMVALAAGEDVLITASAQDVLLYEHPGGRRLPLKLSSEGALTVSARSTEFPGASS